MTDPELWQRIKAHRFDSAAGSEPYSVKLATAEGWSQAHAFEVIQEYRKFLYLTQICDAPVTPSEAIDRAWHMHMTFTRNYWEELCDKVLGAKLHHDPCAGAEEMPRYHEQYAKTRALYLAEFGSEPPVSIWPEGTGFRFGTSSKIWMAIGGALLVLSGFLFVGGSLKTAFLCLVFGLGALAMSLILAFPAQRNSKGVFGAGCGGGSAGCGGGGCGGAGG
jgi:hypothetical protein